MAPKHQTLRPGGTVAVPETYTLMCKNHRVVRFSYTRRTRTARLLEVCDGSRWAPPGACGPDGQVDALNLNGWVSMRYVPHTREGLSGLLREAGCENPADLMFSSLGLNLSDQYWFLPDGMELDWHDINYFENPYVDGRPNGIATDPAHALFGPVTSTGGQVVKWWERRGTQNYLVKGATAYNHEPFAELLATKLYEFVLEPGDYVPYGLEWSDGEPRSVCPCFIDASTELATMDDLVRRYGDEGDPSRTSRAAYIELLERQGIRDAQRAVDKMLVCDFLMANADRHEYNLGAVLDVESRKILRVAPIYDNGRGFFYGARREDQLARGLFEYVSNPFEAEPQRQLEQVEDFGWLDLGRLAGFADVVEDVLAGNELLPSWFAGAAARQFELRVEQVGRAAEKSKTSP